MPEPAGNTRIARLSLYEGGLLVWVLWGVLAFGAVYPWAYWPLAIGAATLGLAGLLTGRNRLPGPLVAGVALIACAIGLQAMPLPATLVNALSPNRAAMWALAHQAADGSLPAAADAPSMLTLSLRQVATLRTLALFTSFALVLLGLLRRLDDGGAVRVAAGVAGMGLVVAAIGLVDSPLGGGPGRIYGFWEPRDIATSFSPFVNRNHFGGWMLMALPLVAGLSFGMTFERRAGARAGWRDAVLWLGSRDASVCALVVLTGLVMAFALMNTMSRSSIAGFLLTATGLCAWLVARRGRRVASFALTAALVLIAVFAIRWTGAEALEQRFTVRPGDISGREAAWGQGARIASRFTWTGSGLNTYRLVAAADGGTTQRFDQTHNDYLQLVAEGGVLVAAPVFVLLAIVAHQIWRRFRERRDSVLTYWIRVSAVAGLIAIALQETVEFSLQMPGNLALCVVLLALAMRPSVPDSLREARG